MKKFLLKLVIKRMRSKFSRQQAHRLTVTAEPAFAGLGARLEFLRQALRRWLLSDAPAPSTGLAQGESRAQGS